MINIQQAAKQMIVLPQDFYIREPNRALVPFGKNGDNNNKKVSTALEIRKGQGAVINYYLNDILLYANELPAEITLM
jgi:hypothetical protein